MTFAFNGVGTRAEVIRQVRSHHVEAEGLGDEARKLVVAALELDNGQDEYGYIVKAYGHADSGGATSLTITIEPIWIPAPRPEARAVSEFVPSDRQEVDREDLGIGI